MTYSIAIVGFGPRGLGAIEALACRLLETDENCDVDVFDPSNFPGAGPNFCPIQSEACLLNIPVRELDIEPPNALSSDIGSFGQWSGYALNSDAFPPRSEIGRYLTTRFDHLKRCPPGLRCITHRRVQVLRANWNDGGWWLDTDDGLHGPYAEMLLTQGQPQSEPDPQMGRWQTHAKERSLDLFPAYPANAVLTAARGWADKSVAIRGLGLSTLDVVRLLTIGVGGQFTDGGYIRSGREPRRIMPFSLDGHPPIPKPDTEALDALFNPNSAETRCFEAALEQAVSYSAVQAVQLLTDAIIAPTLRILGEFGSNDKSRDVLDWLAAERVQPGSQETRQALDILTSGINMALGRALPSLGYVVGQVWRKWQNELRSGFNTRSHNPETAKAIISFDEGLKRFSYGPPVSSAKELLILAQADIVDMRIVDDPDIKLNNDGWRLVDEDVSSQVSVIVDGVLASPELGAITDPLLSSLRESGVVSAVSEGLGAQTTTNGQVVNKDGIRGPGLYLLGRLALGSVIAADSLHDCFGASASRWAQGVAERLRHHRCGEDAMEPEKTFAHWAIETKGVHHD